MITEIDFMLLDFIQQHRTVTSDEIFSFITTLGDSGIIWVVLSVIMLLFATWRKTGIRTLIALALVTIVFTFAMKELVGRERPFNNPMGILQAKDLMIGVPFGRYSFPSGHALTSFAAATSFFLKDKRLGVVCMILAALVAFSRVYLYVHFPSDVIFGAIFGVLSALGVWKVENKLSASYGRRNTKK